MSEFAVISSRELLDLRNNPTGRIDAGFGITLSKVLSKEPIKNPRKTIQGIWKDTRSFNDWIRSIRKQTHLQGVKDLIALALLGKKTYEEAIDPEHTAKLVQKANFSPAVQEGIHQMAISLCEQESQLIEEEIGTELQKIKNLQAAAAETR